MTLVTDHKPLVKLFGEKELRYILNPMLLAMKKYIIYSFNVKYLSDKKNPVDFLSRYPALCSSPNVADEDLTTLRLPPSQQW